MQVADYVAGAITPQQADILNRYWVTLYPEDVTPLVPSTDPWMGLALDPRVLDVVNAYFGLWSKLIYFDVWHSVQVPAERARFGAQRWHRDPEDRKKIRIYLYFSEVDTGSGPLQYIPGYDHRQSP